jgi:hypothetical protein
MNVARDFKGMSVSRCVSLAACVTLISFAALSIGCSIAVDKNKNGDDKNVKIETPLGGVHVTSDSTTAADVGLPVYPGAKLSTDKGKDNDKSADIHFGFGDWQFRLKVVKYQTSDSSDQVLAYYKKALGRYGNVIQCSGHNAVGSPSVTSEGLTCDDSGKSRQVNLDMSQSLKAGSKHHQHIVGIEKSEGDETVFSLVELDLPTSSEDGKAESN